MVHRLCLAALWNFTEEAWERLLVGREVWRVDVQAGLYRGGGGESETKPSRTDTFIDYVPQDSFSQE